MLVRLVEELRREGHIVLPGAFLDVTEVEAKELIEDGKAVPIRRLDLSRETR